MDKNALPNPKCIWYQKGQYLVLLTVDSDASVVLKSKVVASVVLKSKVVASDVLKSKVVAFVVENMSSVVDVIVWSNVVVSVCNEVEIVVVVNDVGHPIKLPVGLLATFSWMKWMSSAFLKQLRM